jgi:aminoglycoside phosphotransferase (APT) family kinase protein
MPENRPGDEPWRAEHELGEELARSLIEEQFPSLAPALLRRFGEGWDNQVFLVEGRAAAAGAGREAWVFRFPRRQVAVPLLQTELLLLPQLAGKLPLPVPLPQFVGAPGTRFPWPFAGYRALDGRTADSAALDDAQRAAAAVPLGRFLRALHALRPPPALAGDRLGRLDRSRLVAQIRERLRALGVEAPRFLDEPVRPARAGTLVHGDLHARQILVDGATRPCGVIDWGDSHSGDPAVDLSVAHSLLPRSAHRAFRDAYGEIDEATWRLSRLRALHVCAALAIYGRSLGDEALQREASSSIHRIAGDG